jgi:hypothetical protein
MLNLLVHFLLLDVQQRVVALLTLKLLVRRDDVLLRKETARKPLRLHHLAKFALPIDLLTLEIKLVDVGLEVVAVPLLDDFALLEHVDEVLGGDLGEVVGDDDGGLVPPPALEGFEDENAGGGVESGGSLI